MAAALFALVLVPGTASAAPVSSSGPASSSAAEGVNDCPGNWICWWSQSNYNGQRAGGEHGADGCWNLVGPPNFAYSMTNNTNVNITMQSRPCGESGQQRAELPRQSTNPNTPFQVRSFLRCAAC
ncbi:hypothetical protein YIM_19370 [Amycolatopsis sp. YIM 10]|nr:hypothetical protein YIM_19370 [Amycolatopsis sp. YIM 10]